MGNANSGRRPGFTMSEAHRKKIADSRVLACLIEHAEGTREMAPSAVTAGLGLIRKFLPDLQAVQHSGDADNPLEVIARIRREIVEKPNGTDA
jgi:hypothetical protein